jgi:EAL domain-containing protein (putative c-di-GMP-specific phosphodiesterase class I)/ActR/RegA family two-component response regulator
LLPKVLLVEDNASVRCVLEAKLSKEFEVLSCANGEEALCLLSPSIDTIVADVHMPRIGGLDLLAEVHKRGLNIPTILITGMPTLEAAQQAMEHNAFRYISKPVHLGTLNNLVRLSTRICQGRRSGNESEPTAACVTQEGDREANLNYQLDEALDMLWLALQPIRDTKRNRVMGYEVLMRTGMTALDAPDKILHAAEILKRTQDVGRRVRRAAAQALGELDSAVDLYVNLHPDDLDDPDLYDSKSSLTRNAKRVVLEITERRGLPSLHPLRGKLRDLRKLGFRIALDDLGSGHNGLATLCSIMPDMVKLDRRLVHGIGESPLQMEIVRALGTICRASNIDVIAEGVEVEGEYAALRSSDCVLMQGYLFGRPQRFSPAMMG